MGAAIAGLFPTKSMKLWKYRCRPIVRDAEAGWKSARPFLSSKPRFRNHGWSALSFVFLSGAVGVADGECRGDIHGKPRMPSAVPRVRNQPNGRSSSPANEVKTANLASRFDSGRAIGRLLGMSQRLRTRRAV